MESDERFKHLATDPRFKTLRRKQRKVQIDDRFKSMFTDEKFTLKYKQDKRGRINKKTSGEDLKKYYHLDEKDEAASKNEDADAEDGEDDEENTKQSDEDVTDEKQKDEGEEEDDQEEIENGDDDEEEEVQEDGADEEDEDDVFRRSDASDVSSTASGELSSSSDESDSEGPESEAEDAVSRIQYDWKPLDHDAERADIVTRRIAIQNLDWNHLDVRDIYTLINSIRPPLSVKIYVSEFGKERLAKEEVEGPHELAEMPQLDEEEEEYQQLEEKMQALEGKGKSKHKVNEYEDADELMDTKNEELRERLRRYQLNQMKYYYAIAEFDSTESAQAVYKELDGIEYEGSSLELDLRYVPDDMDFDPADVKAECDKVPDLATYKAPQFINSALQQTTVKFTWDETDVKRQEKLHRAYTKQELEKDDLEAYLASETDSEEEEAEAEAEADGDKSETMTVMTGNSEARANKYRQLLKSLDEEADRKKRAVVDVEWDNSDSASEEPSEQESGHESDDSHEAGEQESGLEESEEDDEEEEESEGEMERQRLAASKGGRGRLQRELLKKSKKQQQQKQRPKTKEERVKGEKSKRKRDDEMEPADPDLNLLVMDARGAKRDDFKFNPDDDRFQAVYESGLYNIDPSHPNFKRTEAFDRIAERKRDKRRKRNQ